jgi:nucleoside-diphosphate-sugar epimerase
VATIAITGVSGLIGRRLVDALGARDDVDRIVGIDLVAPVGVTAPTFAFRVGDVTDPAIAEALTGADVVVHLAFRMASSRDREAMRAVNVEGTRTVVEAAHRAGVGRLVHLSSVVAYGAHPDNDVPLTEDSPLRGTPDYDYAQDKRDVEAWLWPWHAAHPELALSVLRPAAVLGPGVDNVATRLIELVRTPAVVGHRPPMQFVHVDDVVAAIVHVIDRGLDGAYNVCAEGWLPYDEVVDTIGRGMVEVPEELALTLVRGSWRAGVGELPGGVVQLLMHPWVMSAARLMATGWRPTRTNRETLAEAIVEHDDWVTLGRLRATRTVLAVASRVAAAAATLGVVLAVRRRRARP